MSDLPAELVAARASIDNLDAALVHLLAERLSRSSSGSSW